MDYLPWVSLGASLGVGVAVGYMWYEVSRMKMTVERACFLLSKRIDSLEDELNGNNFD
jgi:hypothetical protein